MWNLSSTNLKSIKKYLVILSLFCVTVISIHLIIKYLYNDAIVTPDWWWVIEVWVVWTPPSLNPLRYKLNSNNDIILPFVFRPLLSYNLEKKQMIWDIANCDITYLDNIKCHINANAVWNNSENITAKDIIATYDFVKRTSINPYFKELLKNVKIYEEELDSWDSIIVFETNTQDVLLLELFTLPIVHHSFIEWDEIKWNITDIASGKYSKATLTYDNKWKSIIILDDISEWVHFIQRYIFKYYASSEKLIQDKSNLHILLTKFKDWKNDSRFKEYSYTTNKFFGAFLNTSRLSKSVRQYISFKVWSAIAGDENIKNKVVSPFFKSNPIFITEYSWDTLEELLTKEWFFKKDKLKEKESINIDDYLSLIGKNKDIYSPTIDKVWATSSSNFLLSAKVPEWITEVHINDYKLKWFSFWDAIFNYRIKVTNSNLKEWVNIYRIFYTKKWKKVEHETITVLYSPDLDNLDNITNNFLQKEKADNVKLKEAELIRTSKFDKLTDNLVYNKDWNNFSIVITYLNTPELKYNAELISVVLKDDPIEVILNPVSIDQLNEIITTWDKKYDILIAWISANTWFVKNNLFPFFHSGQSLVWYNFSMLKNSDLDDVLEKAKESYSAIDNEERLNEINNAENRIEEILKEEAVLIPISQPTSSFMVDGNINNFIKVDSLPNINYLYKILENTYIFTTKKLVWENKSISSYFKYLFKILVNSSLEDSENLKIQEDKITDKDNLSNIIISKKNII